MSTTETPHIARALLAAQRKLTSVPRDGRNAEDGYTYTSSDAMIEAVRGVLLELGVTMRRADFAIAQDRLKTISVFELTHPDSGEQVTNRAEFPVFYDGRQDDDKATASSLTTAWTYWLRDLMALSRKDGTDMDVRPSGRGGPFPTARTQRELPPLEPQRGPRKLDLADELFDEREPEHMRIAEQVFGAYGRRMTRKWRDKLLRHFRDRGCTVGQIGAVVASDVADLDAKKERQQREGRERGYGRYQRYDRREEGPHP